MSPKTSISVASQAASPPTSSRMSMRQSVRSHSGRPSIASVAKDLPADPAMITPAIAATLPAFQMVSDRDKTQERAKSPSDASSLSYEEDHVQYATLQPRTYTPPPLTPSRYEPPSARTEAKPPTPESDIPLEPPARSSLRKRLSKTRKQAPPPLLQTPAYSSNTSRRSPRSSGSNDGSRSTGSRANHRVQASEASQMTIPISEVAFPSPPTISFTAHDLERSRSGSPLRSSHQPEEQQYANMINGYESDADGRIVSVMGSPSMEYHAFIAASQQQLLGHNFGGGNYVSSPRSEQQMSFQPVQGSDFDPHQRPWTAAGSRLPPGQESYQQYNTGSYGRNQNPQPSRGLGYARGSIFPSNMSQMTSATEFSTAPDGKKVKKKRSGFGWLKKAFALSEEEKAAFEEKKRQAQMENEMARMEARNRERIFLDGKRIR